MKSKTCSSVLLECMAKCLATFYSKDSPTMKYCVCTQAICSYTPAIKLRKNISVLGSVNYQHSVLTRGEKEVMSMMLYN